VRSPNISLMTRLRRILSGGRPGEAQPGTGTHAVEGAPHCPGSDSFDYGWTIKDSSHFISEVQCHG